MSLVPVIINVVNCISKVTAINVIAELPCGEKGCSGTPAGPFCDCSGTGFEGQYCSSGLFNFPSDYLKTCTN